MDHEINRRRFLEAVAAAGFGAFAASANKAWGLEAVTNTLAVYPDRNWEKTYRDLFKEDSHFTFNRRRV